MNRLREALDSADKWQALADEWKQRAEVSEAKLEQDACGHGHPIGAIDSSDEGTSTCLWCTDIAAREKAEAKITEYEGMDKYNDELEQECARERQGRIKAEAEVAWLRKELQRLHDDYHLAEGSEHVVAQILAQEQSNG